MGSVLSIKLALLSTVISASTLLFVFSDTLNYWSIDVILMMLLSCSHRVTYKFVFSLFHRCVRKLLPELNGSLCEMWYLPAAEKAFIPHLPELYITAFSVALVCRLCSKLQKTTWNRSILGFEKCSLLSFKPHWKHACCNEDRSVYRFWTKVIETAAESFSKISYSNSD